MSCESPHPRNRPLLERFAEARQITCIGEAMMELSLDDPNSPSASVGVAGDVLNTAYYLRLFTGQDFKIRFATAVGDDPFSQRVKDFSCDAGLLTDAIVTRPGTSVGLYAISTDQTGERSFTYWRSASAAREMMCDNTLVDLIRRPDAVYLSGITIAILPETGRSRLMDWIELYRKDGGLVVFDPNFRPSLWSSLELARSWIFEVLKISDIVLPSFDDERVLWGDLTTKHTVERLTSLGIPAAVVKDGANGPISFGLNCPAQAFRKAALVVDTTGAGDSFNGRFLAELLKASTPFKALCLAHQTAAQVVSVRGAILSKKEIAEM